MAPGEAAFIALGANLGDAPGTLRGARDDLARLGTLTGVSGLYRTVPVGGPPGQPDYLNAAVRLVTPLGPVELLGALHEIERQAGRVRRDRWAARTLDLDLILYGHEVRDTPAWPCRTRAPGSGPSSWRRWPTSIPTSPIRQAGRRWGRPSHGSGGRV